MTRSKEDILRDLAGEQARLAEIERTRQQSQERLESLQRELATPATATPLTSPLPLALTETTPRTAADKVKLFRSLFRGRADIFPTRFVSKTTGKPGYALECSNKWEPALCALKTGGRCGDCSNQAFLPVSDQAVLRHLTQRYVMGVYPLLEDETCWFLAADFD
ncbi:MAG: hypothetical protein LC667_20895, partial [Thioalkalivibrio sp.]|nr:hypothetical protein [Thioalkalivibrio sp.]